ncbi:methyl-accepting chemotaxis protein [uncultured Maritalea sp.]|uniref:methyl-accepting chemotaxis protein n=1 Tax=uncultured Maritalea sp. TaxID=757249 RepID=UPI0026135984|nr:methyl-accepting chemotaxis protein [uncultured Maritalea sp.]
MSIEQLRATATKYAMILCCILAASVCGIEYFVQGAPSIGSAIAVAGLVVLGANFIMQRNGVAFRFAAVAVLMGQVMGLLIAAKGHPFQSDMHMAFFSALAFCALFYDHRPIILGALLVVAHHLFLGMAFEDLVFYGGGSIERVALHGVILGGETVALVWMMTNTQKLLGIAQEKSDLAESEMERRTQVSAEREAAQTTTTEQREKMVTDLREAFGGVVLAAAAGDFTQRIDTNFPDDELNLLADAVNELVETVERGLSDTGDVLSALASYDLTKRMVGTYEGAFLELKQNTNTVADRFATCVSQIGDTSRALKQATSEILAGASDLSERTTRQAESIQETSATTGQLAETVRDNTERAKKAQSSITEARTVAERGGQVMAEANEAMQRITESSSKISDIIGMIDDIAFQTNLLALNASVEAARAGEAGKGFAVVAVEVRRLAQSAAQASSEVKVLIEQSAVEVDGGTKLVSQASENLDGIVTSVRGVTALMDEIARESQEQAASIGEISKSIHEMDQMTQHNAALVQQTNASVDKTQAQATELDHMVERFRIDGREPRAGGAKTVAA